MIVPNIDPATIAATIEANINEYLLSFERVPGAIRHDGPDSVWIDAGVPMASFNSVVYARFSPGDLDARIESVLAHFRRRALPVTWHVGPCTQPADLGRFLIAHGMAHSEDEPGMAIEIDRVRDDVPPPAGLVVEQVQDEAALEQWVAAWLFPVPAGIRRRVFDVLRLRGLGADLPWRYYLGRLDGKPVATSELFVGKGVAAVHYVVTLPELRRRGIGTAMTLHVLREARTLGYRVGVLTASPDGIGVYRRIGFQAYCRFRRYGWEPNHGGTEDTEARDAP